MFLSLRILSKRTFTSLPRYSLEANIKSEAEKWDLLAGISLERLPIITRDYKENEEIFSRFLAEKELENSYKSNFEIRMESDLKRAKLLQEGTIDHIEIDNVSQQTGQDFLDACQEELKSLKLENRKVAEKYENNFKSTRRALDRRLLLLLREKLGEKQYWILPQGVHKGEESLRQTAERVILEKCGPNITVRFLGSCPCGFYKYKYPVHARNNSVGAKIFFFKAHILKGHVDEKLCTEFHWATRKELTLLHEDYHKSIKKFLVDEEH